MIEPSATSVAALHALASARGAQRSARAELTAAQRAAVLSLVDDGATYRDIAGLVGVSYQRVGQIVEEARAPAGPDGTV